MADLLRFFAFYISNLTLWGTITSQVFHVSCSNLLRMLLISSCRLSSIMAFYVQYWQRAIVKCALVFIISEPNYVVVFLRLSIHRQDFILQNLNK